MLESEVRGTPMIISFFGTADVPGEDGCYEQRAECGDDDMVDALAAFATFDKVFHFLEISKFSCFVSFDKCHSVGVFRKL